MQMTFRYPMADYISGGLALELLEQIYGIPYLCTQNKPASITHLFKRYLKNY